MTRVWTEGWELRDMVGYTTTLATIDTSIKRSGGASIKLEKDGGALTYPVSDLTEAYLRFGFYHVGTEEWSVSWRHGSTVLGNVSMNTGHVLQIKVSSTVVDTGTKVIAQSTWYLIEVHIKIDDAGIIEVLLDGNPEADYSGDTKPGTDAHFDSIYFRNNESNLGDSLNIYLDDIALNDTAGGVDDSWCGEGKIIMLTPDDDVTTELTQYPALTDHHADVDDYAADGDTTYVEGSVVDEEDKYTLSASGLTAADVESINRVWCESRSKNTTANPGEVALFIYSDATEGTGADVVLVSSYTTKVKSQEFLQDPDGPAAWSVAALDALQAGIRTRD